MCDIVITLCVWHYLFLQLYNYTLHLNHTCGFNLACKLLNLSDIHILYLPFLCNSCLAPTFSFEWNIEVFDLNGRQPISAQLLTGLLWTCGTGLLWSCGTGLLWSCGTGLLWTCGTGLLWTRETELLWRCGMYGILPCHDKHMYFFLQSITWVHSVLPHTQRDLMRFYLPLSAYLICL